MWSSVGSDRALLLTHGALRSGGCSVRRSSAIAGSRSCCAGQSTSRPKQFRPKDFYAPAEQSCRPRRRDVGAPLHESRSLREVGPLVIERGQGVYVYDFAGKGYIEGMAGLWCTALGYGNEELVEAAAAQTAQTSRLRISSLAKATIRRSSLRRSSRRLRRYRSRRCSSAIPDRKRTTPRSSSFGISTTRAAGRRRKRSSAASRPITASPSPPPRSPGFPAIIAISTFPCRASCTPAVRTSPFRQGWRDRGGVRLATCRRPRSVDRQGRSGNGSPHSSPSRSWAPAASSCRRRPISRRSWRCAPNTICS